MAFICRKQTSSVLFASLSSNFSPMQGIKLRPTERAWATFSPINCTHSPTLLFLLLFIYYTKAAKQHQSKKGDIQYTKERKKAIHRNKTIKSVKHLHIIAAKMFTKILIDQIFRRRNEIELKVDSVNLCLFVLLLFCCFGVIKRHTLSTRTDICDFLF